MAADPAAHPTGNLAGALDRVLGRLGVAPRPTRDSVTATIAAELARRGHRAELVELRWGVLTLRADPQAAALLRYDRDNLLAAIDAACPGAVAELRVRSR